MVMGIQSMRDGEIGTSDLPMPESKKKPPEGQCRQHQSERHACRRTCWWRWVPSPLRTPHDSLLCTYVRKWHQERRADLPRTTAQHPYRKYWKLCSFYCYVVLQVHAGIWSQKNTLEEDILWKIHSRKINCSRHLIPVNIKIIMNTWFLLLFQTYWRRKFDFFF